MTEKMPKSPIFSFIEQEFFRLEHEINLIASENYASPAVMAATGSILTNKYAEGYPGKRYYAGCEIVDKVEQYAIDTCKKLFGAEHVNVQPHAGSQANMAVFFAALKPGDTFLGMSLAEGGHLTHGHKVNFSGKFYNPIQYTLNRDTEQLDFVQIEKLAHEHKPKMIIAGASAYSRTIDFNQFAQIARDVGAYLLTDIAHIAGLVATKLHPSPIGIADFITSTTHKTLRGPRGGLIMCKAEHASAIDRAIMPGTQGGPILNTIAAKAIAFEEALHPLFTEYQQQVLANAKVMAQAFADLGYRIVSGGTDNHLFVVDLRSQGINGTQASLALEKAGIIISKSCIPFDPEKPWITSGIRVGSPAITTRGFKKEEAQQVIAWMHDAIKNHGNDARLKVIREEVKTLCDGFPIYG